MAKESETVMKWIKFRIRCFNHKIVFNTKYLWISFIFVSLLFTIWYPAIIYLRPTDNVLISTYPRLMFGLMTDNSTRNRAYNFNTFFQKSKPHDLSVYGPIFFSKESKSFPGLKVIETNSDLLMDFETYPQIFLNISMKQQSYIDLVLKFCTLLKYFIEETDYEYFIRITDDVFVNFPELGQYIEEIEKKHGHDSIVVVGQCMMVRGQILLQGGAGFLFSRRAALVYYYCIPEVLRTVDTYEDWVLYATIRKMIPDFVKTHSMRFIGHGLSQADRKHLSNGMFPFPICPNNPRSISCLPYPYPLKKVIFFHQSFAYPTVNEWKQIIYNAPNNLMWYQSWYYSALCFTNFTM